MLKTSAELEMVVVTVACANIARKKLLKFESTWFRPLSSYISYALYLFARWQHLCWIC